MKAAVVLSAASAPVYQDFAEPDITGGKELVDLVAAGIHPVVRSLAGGAHYGSTGMFPLVPGIDAVARTADGTLVYTGFVDAPWGTFAERMAVPAAIRMALPSGADPAQVAAGVNPGVASWLPLQRRLTEVPQLGTVVIVGVTGMAGKLAVQNSLALGARRVIGIGRDTASLASVAALGATSVGLTGNQETDAAAIADALNGEAPTIVLDFVWGPPAEATFTALGRRGLGEDDADISYVQIGAMAGANAAVPSSLLRSRHIRISGNGAGSASESEMLAAIPRYLELIAGGRIEVPFTTYPLSRVADAWEHRGAERAVVVAG